MPIPKMPEKLERGCWGKNKQGKDIILHPMYVNGVNNTVDIAEKRIEAIVGELKKVKEKIHVMCFRGKHYVDIRPLTDFIAQLQPPEQSPNEEG